MAEEGVDYTDGRDLFLKLGVGIAEKGLTYNPTDAESEEARKDEIREMEADRMGRMAKGVDPISNRIYDFRYIPKTRQSRLD